MTRTRVRRRRTVVLVTAGMVVGLWSGTVANALDGEDPQGGHPVRTYVVRSGDTLWSIARGIAPEDDPRPVVDAIASMNDLGAEPLVPGHAIRLPA